MLIEEAIKDVVLRLNNINWFENCNNKNAISEYDISYAKDINSVIKHCSSIRWANLTLEKREDVRSYLVVKRVSTSYTWNEVVLYIKSDILPSILERVKEKWNEKYEESEKIINKISSNIVNIIALSAFSEYKTDPFHEELLKIYEQGYFPCGWKGTYPHGKMVIW